MAAESIVTLTEGNFNDEVSRSSVPVLVDFWAEWCSPCRAIAPILDDLAGEYGDKLKIGKVNIDNEQNLAGQFRVMSIPTLLIFKGGQVVEQVVGFKSKKDLKAKLDSVLAA